MRWLLLLILLLLAGSAEAVTFCGPFRTPCWTTAQRPSTPGTGTTGYNTTLALPEFFDGSSWRQACSLTGCTYTGSVLFSAGSAATPSIQLGDATNGFYRVLGSSLCASCSNGPGFSSNSLSVGSLNYRVDGGSGADNVWFKLGTGQAISAHAGADTYVATIGTPSVNISGVAQYIGLNIGSVTVNATDTTTKTFQQAMLEMDKIDFTQSGGAVQYNNAVNTRFRFHFAHAGVTIVDNKGISCVMPLPLGGDQGTVTTYTCIDIPVMSGAAGYSGTNFFGMMFNSTLTASVGSVGGVDLSVRAGSYGAGAANLILDALNGGKVIIRNAAADIAQFGTTGAQLNYFDLTANNTPQILAASSITTNVGMSIYSKGNSPVQIGTAAGTEQFRVAHTASAVNNIQVSGGAAGAPAVVTLAGIGSSADISIDLVPKGAGVLKIGGTNAVSCGPGAPTAGFTVVKGLVTAC